MSNRSNGPKNSVEVLSINSDFNTPGQHNYRVDIGGQVQVTKTESPTMNVFPQSNTPQWRFILSIYFSNSEWKNQYQVGQKFDLVMSETGDLTLKSSNKT